MTRSNADTEMAWIDAWRELYELTHRLEPHPVLLLDGAEIGFDELQAWLQRSAYEGYCVGLRHYHRRAGSEAHGDPGLYQVHARRWRVGDPEPEWPTPTDDGYVLQPALDRGARPRMDLSTLKRRITEIESTLEGAPFVELCSFDTPGGEVSVALTERLRKACKKGKVWKSSAMLTALKNAQYGLDRTRPRSRGGADGVFLLDRDFHPANEMTRKLFDRFLDRPDPLVGAIADALGVRAAELVAVRVVSHHMRLLGVLIDRGEASQLVLVDYDDT